MRYKVYAYVKSETCTSLHAVKPGTSVGRNQEPVSRHGDYNPWVYGKRKTMAIISRGAATASGYYIYRCACLVATLLDWSEIAHA